MEVTPDLEAPRPSTGPGFSEAVTFAFGDPTRDRYGVARVGVSGGENPVSSGLAVLFADGDPVAVRAEGGEAVEGDASSWDAVQAGGVSFSVEEPLRAWRVRFDGGAEGGFDLRFEAVSVPAALDAESPAGLAGGMSGYEQLCRVRGDVRTPGYSLKIDCLGQRGHSWGEPDWEQLTQARTATAWLGPDLALNAVAIRGAKAKGHHEDAIAASLFAAGDDAPNGALTPVHDVEEARLSVTYDGEGRQRKAGFELYEDADGYPHRAQGHVVCGTTLDLGRLTLDCAFFRWHMDGREGVGRYDVLRRADT